MATIAYKYEAVARADERPVGASRTREGARGPPPAAAARLGRCEAAVRLWGWDSKGQSRFSRAERAARLGRCEAAVLCGVGGTHTVVR